MRVRIVADDAVDGNMLYSWLEGDPAVVRAADLTAPPANPGGMGAFDVVDILLAHATALGSLAVSVATWRGTRPTPPALTFRRADGATLTIPAGTDVDPQVIEDFLHGGDDSTGGGAGA